MRIRRAWVAELAELASFSKTEESRLKAFFTLREDAYIPKFSNFEVTHKRRTVFIATHNPEGDESYLRGQTGNTRYLPVRVRDINIDGFLDARDTLFAEALYLYRKHPDDWWQLSGEGEYQAVGIREKRRQQSVYEDNLGHWLEQHGKQITWWDDIAENYLQLPKRSGPIASRKWKSRKPSVPSAGARISGSASREHSSIPGVQQKIGTRDHRLEQVGTQVGTGWNTLKSQSDSPLVLTCSNLFGKYI